MSNIPVNPSFFNPHLYNYVPSHQVHTLGVSPNTQFFSATSSQEDSSNKYLGHTARNLLDIALTAVELDFFIAPHGQKTARRNELQSRVNVVGVQGSYSVLEARLHNLLAWHKVFMFQTSHVQFHM